MYHAIRTNVYKEHPLYAYCLKVTEASKLLYNASLFRVRNRFTGYSKTSLTENELEVAEEVRLLDASQKIKGDTKELLYYNRLEKLMRVTNNPDFFNDDLSKQTAQHVVREAVEDFTTWLKSLKEYKRNPSKYTGCPKMPRYKKASTRTTSLTNQDCKFVDGHIKFPLTSAVLKVGGIPSDSVLKEVKIEPYYDAFVVICTFETKDIVKPVERSFMAGIDLGVDNIAAITTNEGHSLLFKGGAVKAENQRFNKERARLISCITKGHETKKNVTSRRLSALSRKRDCFLRDQMHKISKSIISFCVEHKVGTIVVGSNKGWKQNSNLGDSNNQNFVQIPLTELRTMIKYKAERAGIEVIDQEESYTSKADFLKNDYIPTFGVDDEQAFFSGHRIKRGLYKSGAGMFINADLNGAANILRKAISDAFLTDIDYSSLSNPQVVGFKNLN